jgi:predicted Zn-dependent peptidase
MIFEPCFREFYIERDVVADERRSFTENNPDGEMGEVILETAFKDGPYRWSTIGFMDDIQSLTIADARKFHAKHYIPSNMVGVIVGDVNLGRTKRIIRKVFGHYPDRPVSESPSLGSTPIQNVIKRFHFDAEPSFALAYHKPTLPNQKEYVFDVITNILCNGRSSRIRKKLMYDRKMIQNLYCSDGYPGSRLDNLLILWIDPMEGYSMQTVLDAVVSEVDTLSAILPDSHELARVQNQTNASVMFALDENMSLAQALGRFQTVFGDWRILADYTQNISAVTAEDVLDVAREYLGRGKRIVVERLKK